MSAFERLRNCFMKASSGSGTLADPWVPSVAIDQATDGTTNKVVPPLTRVLTLSTTFTPHAGYSVAQNVGGLLTIATGLPQSTPVVIDCAALSYYVATISAVVAKQLVIFNAAPAGTFTDNVSVVWVSGDAAKIAFAANLGASIISSPATDSMLSHSAALSGREVLVGASGNLWAVLISSGTDTYTGPGTATLALGLRY